MKPRQRQRQADTDRKAESDSAEAGGIFYIVQRSAPSRASPCPPLKVQGLQRSRACREPVKKGENEIENSKFTYRLAEKQ